MIPPFFDWGYKIGSAGKSMSNFRKISYTLWFCEYQIVCFPKYRYRVLCDKLKEEVECSIREQSRKMEIEVLELKVQEDHVHMLLKMPPRLPVSSLIG